MKTQHNNKNGNNNTIAWLLVAAVAATTLATSALADDRRAGCERSQREERHNYILERQQAYQVQGVPTERLIIGEREIDVYRNGVMFEGNNVVGFRPH